MSELDTLQDTISMLGKSWFLNHRQAGEKARLTDMYIAKDAMLLRRRTEKRKRSLS
jgi:hypothetical protein